MKTRIILIIALLALLPTILNAEESETIKSSLVQSSALANANSSAIPAGSCNLADGVYGLIKIMTEHTLDGKNPKGKDVTGKFAAQGAGSVVIVNGKMYVITAKHVVVPNANIKQLSDKKNPKEKVEFSNVSVVGAKVLIGALSVEPTIIWLSMARDIAVLEVASKDYKAVLDMYQRDPAAPIAIFSIDDPIKPGLEIEAWGFPAQSSPQVEKVVVCSSTAEHFVLNRSLLRGYSGGLVFMTSPKGKAMGGVIIRADDVANQTTVLSWVEVTDILKVAISDVSKEGVIKVVSGSPAKIGNVIYRYRSFYAR